MPSLTLPDYTLVHVKFTIPPALFLTVLARPLLSRIDVYKILFLISISVVSTIPWDSYLIRHAIWTYPPHSVLGPKLFHIPIEELFFFVIQTYITSLLYLLLSKSTFHALYLVPASKIDANGISRSNPKYNTYRLIRNAGDIFLAGLVFWGARGVREGGAATYLGLILIWAIPFVILLWTLGYQLVLGLPYLNTVVPIVIPTAWLWMVDTLALRKGTWVIESHTKLGIYLWHGLEIEEAVFFFLTNTLVVFGLIAFDNALAVVDACPSRFPHTSTYPSPLALVQALLLDSQNYNNQRLKGLSEAVRRLRNKSRSFFLASGAFEGPLREDLILLYSFCRTVDDLVDEAATAEDSKRYVAYTKAFLREAYSDKRPRSSDRALKTLIETLPKGVRNAYLQLPTSHLVEPPLQELLRGMETDLEFSAGKSSWPIKDENDLEEYGERVAGTVAELCIHLIYFRSSTPSAPNADVKRAGRRMGVALQYINIARDIQTDAENGRVYLPADWLQGAGITHEKVLKDPAMEQVKYLKKRLINKAMMLYEEAKPYMDRLPSSGRAPLKVAVESYVEIGRVMQERGYRFEQGKATVPKLRRLWVAWKALNNG